MFLFFRWENKIKWKFKERDESIFVCGWVDLGKVGGNLEEYGKGDWFKRIKVREDNNL